MLQCVPRTVEQLSCLRVRWVEEQDRFKCFYRFRVVTGMQFLATGTNQLFFPFSSGLLTTLLLDHAAEPLGGRITGSKTNRLSNFVERLGGVAGREQLLAFSYFFFGQL